MLANLVYAAMMLCSVQATFDDMDDGDFATFVQAHENVRVEHGASIVKGCLNGAVCASPGGFGSALGGCGLGAAGNFVSDFIVDDKREFVMPEGYYYPGDKK